MRGRPLRSRGTAGGFRFLCMKKDGERMGKGMGKSGQKGKERPHIVVNTLYFLKWSAVSVVLGGLGGLAGSLFWKGIDWVTGLRGEYPALLFAMPLCGAAIVWMYRTFHEEGNTGTNMVIDSISSNGRVTRATGPLIFVSTLLTHLAGGSSGREGAALQLGGSMGSAFGEMIGLDEKDLKIATMCGMSAVFSALFGTPIAAGIFSLEVVSIGVLYYAALVPCLFSAFTAEAAAAALGVPPERFLIGQVPEISLAGAGLTVLLGILCAVVSVIFCIMLHGSAHLYQRWFKNPYGRILAASGIFIALTLLEGSGEYMGSGLGLIGRAAFLGEAKPEAFFLKMLFTSIALGAGFKGGEIVPTLCVGATFGCAFGNLFGFRPDLCAACGMAALFVGVTNCPITSLILSLELFGYGGMEYFSIIIAVSFALSGYYGLYASQKFAYSKTRTEFINRRSH